jgi:ESCRT-I complex subunit TSG101
VDYAGTVQAELASIRQTQQELRTGHDKLKRMLEELDNEQRAIDTASLLYQVRDIHRGICIPLQEKKLELQRVLESTRGGDDALGVDGVIEPQFPLHRQLLANYVADCAIDDAVYFLGQALKKNAISLQEYLNQVRQLSRRQFIHRATMQKCRVKARLPV